MHPVLEFCCLRYRQVGHDPGVLLRKVLLGGLVVAFHVADQLLDVDRLDGALGVCLEVLPEPVDLFELVVVAVAASRGQAEARIPEADPPEEQAHHVCDRL